MRERLTVLPDAAELLERLKGVDDDPYMVERFYPHIIKSAGQQFVAGGIVMFLTLAINDFVVESQVPEMVGRASTPFFRH